MRECKKTGRKMDHSLNVKKFLRTIMIFSFFHKKKRVKFWIELKEYLG